MATTTFTVTGMTCDHCVRSVQSEVSKLIGVTEVEVDLSSGQVTVESSGELDAAAIAAAVEEAGYEVES